ncbi:hypothetical protein VTK73DRAFT_1390 [Phialemonium thermophilum]|uniref:Secreted protein n=1 Tax=Phialemonium thermophilum TaxID=223376 RepID=A0ABR3VTJ5_9PEZI
MSRFIIYLLITLNFPVLSLRVPSVPFPIFRGICFTWLQRKEREESEWKNKERDASKPRPFRSQASIYAQPAFLLFRADLSLYRRSYRPDATCPDPRASSAARPASGHRHPRTTKCRRGTPPRRPAPRTHPRMPPADWPTTTTPPRAAP